MSGRTVQIDTPTTGARTVLISSPEGFTEFYSLGGAIDGESVAWWSDTALYVSITNDIDMAEEESITTIPGACYKIEGNGYTISNCHYILTGGHILQTRYLTKLNFKDIKIDVVSSNTQEFYILKTVNVNNHSKQPNIYSKITMTGQINSNINVGIIHTYGYNYNGGPDSTINLSKSMFNLKIVCPTFLSLVGTGSRTNYRTNIINTSSFYLDIYTNGTTIGLLTYSGNEGGNYIIFNECEIFATIHPTEGQSNINIPVFNIDNPVGKVLFKTMVTDENTILTLPFNSFMSNFYYINCPITGTLNFNTLTDEQAKNAEYLRSIGFAI